MQHPIYCYAATAVFVLVCIAGDLPMYVSWRAKPINDHDKDHRPPALPIPDLRTPPNTTPHEPPCVETSYCHAYT